MYVKTNTNKFGVAFEFYKLLFQEGENRCYNSFADCTKYANEARISPEFDEFEICRSWDGIYFKSDKIGFKLSKDSITIIDDLELQTDTSFKVMLDMKYIDLGETCVEAIFIKIDDIIYIIGNDSDISYEIFWRHDDIEAKDISELTILKKFKED